MSKPTFTNSSGMALEQPRGALGKVYTVFATKLKSFTFLPILKKLPKESRFKSTLEKKSERQKALDPEVSEDNMTDEDVYKAEIVYVTDTEDTEPREMVKYSKTQLKCTDNSAFSSSPSPATANVEITCPSSRPGPMTMEPNDKQPTVSQKGCRNTVESAEVSPELFLNHLSQREEEVLSPASSVDLFPSIASSKESILYDCWEQERSWSALPMFSPGGSPLSFSRTVSPCSSVRSGAFTPSVLRIKRHTLAPGSSLVQMPHSSGQAVCCDSQAPSPCPLSPRARHRPPPTQLSLLTAILRKGRLPILSSALQRPYSPCWPISPASMSSCTACTAASNITPVEAKKTCASDVMAFMEPSVKARPMPPSLINNSTLSMSFKEPKVSTASLPLRTPDTFHSQFSSEFSAVVPSPIYNNSQTLPRSPPSEPALGCQSKSGWTGNHEPTLSSPLPFSSFSTSRPMSPKLHHVSCCSSENCSSLSKVACVLSAEHSEQSHRILEFPRQGHGHKSMDPFLIPKNAELSLDVKDRQMQCDPSTMSDLKPAQQSKDVLASTVLKEANFHFQNVKKDNLERVLLASPALKLSPSSRPLGLTRLSDTPDFSPASPRPSSRSPTPDPYTLSPSPAFPSRQLSPSPSYSLCSSPSPCQDKKPYKIKSTYKALAAIPTNTLLLEQQAINDDVEKNEAIMDPTDNFAWEDPHSQMCTPAQLRQQSAELYAAIDEALEDTNLTHKSNPANNLAVTSAASETPRKSASSPLPQCLGRETKYANFHLQVPGPAERAMTKPGVIRPLIVTRLDDVKDEEYVPNPFQRYQDTLSNRHKYKFASGVLSAVDEEDRRGTWEREMLSSEEQRRSVPSPARPTAQPLTAEGAPALIGVSLQGVPSSLKPVQVKMETPETPI
ncbi:muscular LMNA-interacting protein isoform X1 [Astyanax mexicanus]|uniref:Muscular LMNA interacting protein n=1 Tax=Astyanax mexicanus TaxID=7994 RepID=A0A8B9HYW5_ASTMX|nr:muscular LMNA-interacting protein isoform X1 [Astyanax mexicanus]